MRSENAIFQSQRYIRKRACWQLEHEHQLSECVCPNRPDRGGGLTQQLPFNITRNCFVCVLMLLSLNIPAFCTPSHSDLRSEHVPRGDAVDRYIQHELVVEKIPGLALGIFRRGRTMKMKGYGIANLELGVPVSPQTIFQVGSITKQFTATAIMLLAQDGKLNLDDSIATYLKEAPPAWVPIKIKHLLAHTSGLSEYNTAVYQQPGALFDPQRNISEEEFLARLARLPITSAPGKQAVYRNTNYVLLGMIIEKVTGRSWEQLVRDRIFEPLGMRTAGFQSSVEIIPNRAEGYWIKDGKLQNQEWEAPVYAGDAAGGIMLDLQDFAKWDSALYSERLLKPQTFDQMWTVVKLDNGHPNEEKFGFGWKVESLNGHRLIEHEGSLQGFSAVISRYVDEGLTVVVLTNLNYRHVRTLEIAHRVAGLVDAKLDPNLPQPLPDSDPARAFFFRTAIENLTAGTLDPKTFAASMRADFPADELRAFSGYLRSQGPIDRFDLLEQNRQGDKHILRYLVHFRDGGYFTFEFGTGRDGQITNMGFQN